MNSDDLKRDIPAHSLWRRYLYILLLGGWMGGFTFYALIVIPTARGVLESERDAGFITQQVTRWLNVIGAAVLPVVAGLVTVGWRAQPPRLRLGVAATWVVMVVAQAGLFITHPFMDALLETPGHKIHHPDQFENLHTVYLTFATVQWIAAMLQIWLMLMIWRGRDARPSASVN